MHFVNIALVMVVGLLSLIILGLGIQHATYTEPILIESPTPNFSNMAWNLGNVIRLVGNEAVMNTDYDGRHTINCESCVIGDLIDYKVFDGNIVEWRIHKEASR